MTLIVVFGSPLVELGIEAELLFAAIAIGPVRPLQPLAAELAAPPTLSVEPVVFD